ncbi:NAD(P)H-hydrate dehydratase [Chitinimonas sp. BJB300]|uniref:NAD(P)H-hydrate dehydratase n=1 Tax=Chitinimonas sp. BJB300 TaxID=1559339 RepID=UPI0013041494|nr:NAD(P)H-hydrate dehydratase [Chitinimonas sp. BJB300]
MFYSVAQLRQIEHAAQAQGLPLMQRAGLAAADFIRQRFGQQAHVLILAGPGNNGGDALVAARLLRELGYPVTVVLPSGPSKLPIDATLAYRDWRTSGGVEVHHLPASPYHVVIDGLFGIGLNRRLDSEWETLINSVNGLGLPVLALDVPSGILADSGALPSVAIYARWTLSFIATARGLLTGAACNHVGERQLATLGLSPDQLPNGELQASQEIAQSVSLKRESDSHKGSFGSVLILGGAAGMAGASMLAGRAALHAGCGKVFVGQLDPHGPSIDLLRPELMFRQLTVIKTVSQLSESADVIVLGPGLGQSDMAKNVVTQALQAPKPLLIDADALNLIAADTDLAEQVRARKSPTVLTPHPSEAARLLACSTATIQAQRFDAAQTLATRFHATVVLKGAGSLVADETQIAVNTGGSAAMANVGQGDVLSGLIGALLAQGLNAWQAANLGVWAHGKASDQLVARTGGLVTLADEVASEVGRVLSTHQHL